MELDFQEVLQDFSTLWMLLVEELRVKLNSKQRPFCVLHGLDGARGIEGGPTEAFRQFFYLVKMGVPDSDLSRQALEEVCSVSFADGFNGEVAAFA